MENLYYNNNSSLFISNFLKPAYDIIFVYGILFVLLSALIIFISLILYSKIRRKFPVRVNCWFCNTYTKVPYELSNSWDCPQCKQYNGFNKDGGYNKVIKQQHNGKLNEDIFKNFKTSFINKKNLPLSNGFCKLCNINQQLKIQQLAQFVPFNESNYFQEVEEFREKLEKAYKLCSKCEKVLQETLEKQEYNLLQNRLNIHKQTSSVSRREKIFNKLNWKLALPKVKRIGISTLRWTCMVLNILLLFALIFKLETDYRFIHIFLPEFLIIHPLESVFKVISQYLNKILTFGRELSFAGFFCCLLSHSARQEKVDQVNLLFWGLLNIILWSTLTSFQIIICGISFLLNSQSLRRKQIYLSKKLLGKKSSFQPKQQIFSKAYTFRDCDTIPSVDQAMFSPIIRNDGLDLGMNSSSSLEKQTNQRQEMKTEFHSTILDKEGKIKLKKENEVETTSIDDSSKTQAKLPEPLPTSNSSVFSKSFLSSLETEKNEGNSNEPIDAVYSNLSGLSLGGKNKKKSKKSSKFLFENHNFSEKKNSSSIIKPARFIKNLSNSWTGQESNESASRSSTPSSGYSSQKAEKIDGGRYEFGKTMTPTSVNPYGRPNPFDYYDGNNCFYNGFSCFSPGFVPFQQFSGPMGHTTVYTYTRPTNFPFPFSPTQGFPNNKLSPSSPRLSEASDFDNLFQNTSRSFENKKKWFKLKTIFYHLSIFLNVITLVGLIYFVSGGIILVDWKIPTLNMFL